MAGLPAASPWLLPSAGAQTLTTGSLSGTVTDPSGAVVPGANVTVTNLQGATHKAVSNAEGRFSFPLLPPSTYTVAVEAQGMSLSKQTVPVQVGQSPNITVAVAPGGASQNVTVNADTVPLTDTQSPALVTTFTAQQIQDLPAPGGDITTVAFTAPGVVTNGGSGYGNFSVDGLPGTSNLYVINGFNEEDPFLNLNNSGSSNLTLGQAEIAEASVVVNGYSAQYGRQAGAIVEYTTKSGSNAFHGMANYYYNGDTLNANDWFRNFAGEGRQRAISNQWAGNVGGPIIKNKLFFFADYEGLRYVLPNAGQAVFPSQQMQSYILSQVQQSAPANVAFYRQAFGLYNASPNAQLAVPVANGSGPLQDSSGNLGCGPGFAGTPTGTGGTFGVDTPCTTVAEGNASNINKEYLFATRVDWNISDRQRIFGRFKLDHGTQPTSTSFISPIFNTTSSQPSYEGQLEDSFVITPHLSNQFVFAANWYTAYFGPANIPASLAAFPTYVTFGLSSTNGGYGISPIGISNVFPQGRNVFQYQFVDDLSYVRNNHTFQVGFDFRREDLSDYDAQAGKFGTYSFNQLNDFASGTIAGQTSSYSQTFATQNTAYLALYNLGAYLQDNWQATPRLHLTYGVRFDRNGNGLCNNNCFANYNGTFSQAAGAADLPYSQIINANQAHAFNNVEAVVAQGRAGFNYSLTPDGHTVLRGGVGLFADTPPAIYLDSFAQNFPQLYSATVTSGAVGLGTTAGTAGNNAALSNVAIQNGFHTGQTPSAISNTLNGLGAPFTPPNFTVGPNTFRIAKYMEYNLQFQRQFSASDSVSVGYVGNVGSDEFMENSMLNASVQSTYGTFGGLQAAPANPGFQQVNGIFNSANSSYNALQVTYKHVDRRGLTVSVNYAYSHALDDVSNGGIGGEPYNGSKSITSAVTPFSLSALNYGNADYDTRHNITADYLYQMPFLKRYGKVVNSVAGGWMFSGKTYWRTGNPFSVVDSGLAQAVGGGTIGGTILATVAPGATFSHTCKGNGQTNPCINANDFLAASTETGFGNLARNSFYGPHYADSDFALSKKFVNTEKFSVQLGTFAFNVFNHPNFATPSNDVNGGNIGVSSSIVAPPSSPYGSFSSAGVGGRVLQVFGKIIF